MKKSILAPAVAVAVASAAFAGAPAFATTTAAPTAEATAEAPAAEPVLTVDPTEITSEQLTEGDMNVTFTVSNLTPGAKVDFKVTSPNENVRDFTSSATANAEGNAVSGVTGISGDYTGVYTVTATLEDSTVLTGKFNVGDVEAEEPAPEPTPTDEPTTTPTENPEPTPEPTPTEEAPTAAPTPSEDPTPAEEEKVWEWTGKALKDGLNISHDVISPKDFVNSEKGGGVAFAVKGCEPGATVTFEASTSSSVEPYVGTATADEHGVAVHGVYGINADNPEAYLGDYTVKATCGDESWTGSFTVGYEKDADAGADDSSKKDDSSNNSGSRNELPRTGAELGGLAAGAGLLLVGGAAVLLTRRKHTSL